MLWAITNLWYAVSSERLGDPMDDLKRQAMRNAYHLIARLEKGENIPPDGIIEALRRATSPCRGTGG